MTDVRRVAVVACVLLVVLRIVIGWQLLYEGLWKINTLKSATPWTAAGYLKNSQGPLRGHFRSLAGDPDDLSWIETESHPSVKGLTWVPGVERKWNVWHKRFIAHYKLNDSQQRRLNALINGSKEFAAELEILPPSVDFEALGLASVISYNAEKKRLVVDGVRHLIPEHRAKIQKSVDSDVDGIPNSADFDVTGAGDDATGVDTDEDGIDDAADVDSTGGQDENGNGIDDSHPAEAELVFLDALEKVFLRSKNGMGYKEKLRATVNGNPDWVENKKLQRVGEIKKYKSMLAKYEKDLARARANTSIFPFHSASFEFDHLSHSWKEIQGLRTSLVGPAKALDKELKEKALDLLIVNDEVNQLAKGHVPEPWTPLRVSDLMTILGLTILGAMLVLGLGTRLAAIMGAVMLFMFYAAMPPWPGVPEIPGPEHSFIVNKNFIEVIALLAIATLPTGRWFGVDGMLGWLRRGRKSPDGAKFKSKWDEQKSA